MTEKKGYESWTDDEKWGYLLRHERLGELLVRQGKLTIGQLEALLREQVKTRNTKHLGEILVEMKYLTLDEIMHTLDNQHHIQQTGEQAIQELKNKSKD
jgi:hypothetical protein